MESYNIDDIDIRQNVSDLAGIIEPGYEKKIHDVIDDIEARTTAETAVVTLESLKGISIDDAANRLFNKLGLGKKDADNGILLLISSRDGKFRIELGYGLENIIDASMRDALVEKVMSPQFSHRHFGPAILGFLKKVRARIIRSRMSNLSLVSWLAGILSLVFAAAGIFSSLVLALTTFPDIGRLSGLVPLFLKTCAPSVILALAAAVLAVADFNLDEEAFGQEKIVLRSIGGLVMGSLAVIIIFASFFLFPMLADLAAGILSLPTSFF